MDVQGMINEARVLVQKVESNPDLYKGALANGLEAIKLVQEVISKLKSGDTVGASSALTDWEDVNRTIQVRQAIQDEVQSEKNETTLEEVAQGIGAAVKVATFIAKVAF